MIMKTISENGRLGTNELLDQRFILHLSCPFMYLVLVG